MQSVLRLACTKAYKTFGLRSDPLEGDKNIPFEQLSLNFEVLLETARRICERYRLGPRESPAAVHPEE